MNKNVIAFRKGLRIFWEQEFMPVARELAPIIRPVLAKIKGSTVKDNDKSFLDSIL